MAEGSQTCSLDWGNVDPWSRALSPPATGIVRLSSYHYSSHEYFSLSAYLTPVAACCAEAFILRHGAVARLTTTQYVCALGFLLDYHSKKFNTSSEYVIPKAERCSMKSTLNILARYTNNGQAYWWLNFIRIAVFRFENGVKYVQIVSDSKW